MTIDAQRLADAVEISVCDTGIGIAESDHESAFEAFRQLDSTIAREQRGTGLGLALTKRFVDLHRGQITLVSELGRGSVFTLRLPLMRHGVDAVASVQSWCCQDVRRRARHRLELVSVTRQGRRPSSRTSSSNA